MYLQDLEYYVPDNIQEASSLLAELGPNAKLLAGGTDVLPSLKRERINPQALISLKNLGTLKDIQYVEGRGVVIGALATLNELMNSPILQEKYLSVSEAAHHMANNQIRNKGTIGGNIVNAVPSADLPPILIALGATVTLESNDGKRTMALEDFFTGPSQSVIKPDEILTEVVIPDKSFTGSAYQKFGLRRSGALAVVGVAVAVRMDGDTCIDAGIALGAVAPTPIRVEKAEQLLQGKIITEEIILKAAEMAAETSKPISDIRASKEYRQDMVRVFTMRMLKKAIDEG